MKPTIKYLTGARLVLKDEILDDASLLIEDGIITAINPENHGQAKEVHLEGQTLMPGMIDLHCDALEKEYEPRPGVHFPIDFAVAQADKRNAAAGISTVFHALSFANDELGVRNNEVASTIVRAIAGWKPHALVDNRVHCRYEVTDPTALPVLFDLIDDEVADMISVMDHTPNQGQFKNMAAYKAFHARNYKKDDAQLDQMLQQKLEASEGAFDRIKQLVSKAQQAGVRVASHDDDTIEKIKIMQGLGVQISEFPINLETAQAAKKAGLHTVFGAPNVLRGSSQSGSMKAVEAIHQGVADCLCADYSPASLIVAVMRLPEMTELSLPQAVQLVTTNPAEAAGLGDRGEVAVGKRADLIAVQHLGKLPQVGRVWINGVLAFQARYDHG